MKVLMCIVATIAVFGLATAQTRSRPTKSKTNRNRSRNEPVEQGRTLGLLRPILGLGLNTLTQPLTNFGFDEPIAPNRPYRPYKPVTGGGSQLGSAQSDSYYGNGGGAGYGGFGGYGGYGGLLSNIFGGYGSSPYNNYGGYQQQYRPQYNNFNGGYNYGGYRPQAYRPQGLFGGFNGYPSNNGYGGQQFGFGGQQSGYGGPQSGFGGQQSGFGGQRPGFVGSSNFNSLSATTAPSSPGVGSAGSQIDPAQAAQVANLLGQLLGSQLRPLLSQGGAAAAADELDTTESRLLR